MSALSLDELESRLRPIFLAALAGDAAAYRLFLDTISVRLRGYLRQMMARAGRPEASEVEDVLQALRDDASRPPPGFPLAIPMQFANENFVEIAAGTAREALESLHKALDGMLRDYAAIADRVWVRVDEERSGVVTKAQFVERFRAAAIPWQLVEPANLAAHLLGEFNPDADADDESI